jgi:NADH dehydrogenase
VGKFVNDVMITKDEVKGLMANLLYVETQPAGTTKLTDWAKKHANTLGFKYTSELARRKDRDSEYMSN